MTFLIKRLQDRGSRIYALDLLNDSFMLEGIVGLHCSVIELIASAHVTPVLTVIFLSYA